MLFYGYGGNYVMLLAMEVKWVLAPVSEARLENANFHLPLTHFYFRFQGQSDELQSRRCHLSSWNSRR